MNKLKTLLIILLIMLISTITNAQSLTGIAPNPVQRGQTLNVTITGANTHFKQATTSVAFFKNGTTTNDIIINSFSSATNTSVTANITIAPTALTGLYDITVYNTTDGLLSLNSTFYITNSGSKTIAISPATATKGQTLNVTITGTNTSFTQGSNTLTFFGQGSSSAFIVNSLNVVNSTQIIASVTIPFTAVSGPYSLTLSTISDGTLSLSNSFTVAGSYLSSSTPTVSQRGNTLNVTITGINTHFDQGSATISFFKPGSPTSNLTVNFSTPMSATSIIANVTVPVTALIGSYNLTVSHSLDGPMNLTSAIAVQSGSLSSVSPNSSPRAQTLIVTITGNGTAFQQGSSTLAFFKSGTSTYINVGSVIVNSSSSLSASITVQPNAIVGSYDVRVTSPLDGSLTIYSGFSVTGPSISSISPTSLSRGNKLALAISGANTHFDQGTGTAISFWRSGIPSSGITVDSTKIYGPTNMTAYISVSKSAPGGNYVVHAYNGVDFDMIYASGVNVAYPSLTTITPNSSPAGRTLDVTISGKGTNFTQASSMNFGFFLSGSPTANIIINSVNIANDSSAILHINVLSSAASGYYLCRYSSIDDGTLNSSFIISPGTPSLLSVTPPSANRAQTLDVLITGQNTAFTQASGSNMVTFLRQGTPTADITVNSVTVMSDNVLKTNITINPAAVLTGYDVRTENNIDGILNLSGAFTVLNTGLYETQDQNSSLNIYPNPARDIINIELKNSSDEISQVILCDIAGRKIYEMASHGFSLLLPLTEVNITKGIYIVRLAAGEHIYYRKILIE